MRRIIETDENGNIRITGNSHTEIWMTAWEMAELFNATVPSIQKEIKAVRKSGIFTDYEVCKYIRMENGYSADIFNLDIIIAVAYRVNTFYTHAFRKWLKKKPFQKISRNKNPYSSCLTKGISVKDGIGNEKADGHSRLGDCPSAFPMFSRSLVLCHSSALR